MTNLTPKLPDRMVAFPGTVDQFAKLVPAALQQLYKRDTERLAEKFKLDGELVSRMRQRNLKRLAKEAGLSPKHIEQLKADNTACLSTGLDYYPSTQQLVEDFSFVLDESTVKRDFIIHALQSLQQTNLTANTDNFIREAWPPVCRCWCSTWLNWSVTMLILPLFKQLTMNYQMLLTPR